MGRSGYTDDYGCDDPLAMGRYRQAVRMAIQGKRGQAFLREMLEALDALPKKHLVSGSFTKGGGCCALGSVAAARGEDVSRLERADPGDVDADDVAFAFGIAPSMAREIMFMNDEGAFYDGQGEGSRFHYVRNWIVRLLNGEDPS